MAIKVFNNNSITLTCDACAYQETFLKETQLKDLEESGWSRVVLHACDDWDDSKGPVFDEEADEKLLCPNCTGGIYLDPTA